MESKTLVALRAVLDMDSTISEEHREGIIQFALGDTYTVANILREAAEDEVVSIEKAASILGKSKPTIERYIRDGLLIPIIPKGKTRAIGVSLKSVRNFGRHDDQQLRKSVHHLSIFRDNHVKSTAINNNHKKQKTNKTKRNRGFSVEKWWPGAGSNR